MALSPEPPRHPQPKKDPKAYPRRQGVATDQVTFRRVARLGLRLFRVACLAACVIGIGCGLYLTLRPSSVLSEVPWLPKGIAAWADSYGRFRNFPAYATLGVPFMVVCNGRRARAKAIGWLALFGAVVEGLQYFIPTRWCEWQDVAWSWAGLLATWIIAEVSFRLAWKIRCAFKARSDPRRVARVLDSVLPRTRPAGKS